MSHHTYVGGLTAQNTPLPPVGPPTHRPLIEEFFKGLRFPGFLEPIRIRPGVEIPWEAEATELIAREIVTAYSIN